MWANLSLVGGGNPPPALITTGLWSCHPCGFQEMFGLIVFLLNQCGWVGLGVYLDIVFLPEGQGAWCILQVEDTC